MQAYTRRRLIASGKLGLAAVPCFVGLTLLQDQNLAPGHFLFSFSAGFMVGVAELFVLRNWMRHSAFLPHLVVKSAVIVALMYLVFAALNTLDVVAGRTWSEYVEAVFSRGVFIAIIQGFAVISFLLFFVHLDRLLGPGVLLGYVTGRYHRPRSEERVFVFVDLKGSTQIAETMPGERYYLFLSRYFGEMAEPVLVTGAEIYQYVGDEVVLTWPIERGLDEASCLRVVFLLLDRLESKRDRFLSEFGVVPEFKAGAHCGRVITAQIGEVKREIVYNGDVLNTASRIQSKCNELGRSLLISADLAERLTSTEPFDFEPMGSIALRGKQESVSLVSVTRIAP